jgi:hypothetical protein
MSCGAAAAPPGCTPRSREQPAGPLLWQPYTTGVCGVLRHGAGPRQVADSLQHSADELAAAVGHLGEVAPRFAVFYRI